MVSKLRAGQCGENRAGRRMCVLDGLGARFVGKDFDPQAEGFEVVGVDEDDQEPEDELSERVGFMGDAAVEKLGRSIADAINEAIGPVADTLDDGEDDGDEDLDDDGEDPVDVVQDAPRVADEEAVSLGVGFQR